MTTPRVLIWYWGRFGGGPLVTELLVRHLMAQGFEGSIALSLSTQNERPTLLDLPSIEVHQIDTFAREPGLGGLLRRLPQFRRLFRDMLERIDPDVIVVPMLFGALAPLMDIARESGRRIVYVVHDAARHPGDSHGLAQTLSQRLMLHAAHDLVAMSDTIAAEVKRRIPGIAHKVTAQPLAGLFEIAAEPRERPTGELRFLMPGRVVRYKGYERLASALARMPRNGFRVTVCGSGPYERTVEALFRGDPRVSVSLSWHSPAQHADLFRSHDVVLCPYDEASQSAVVCEALSAALPCIVTPVGALPEQVGDGTCGVVLRDMTPDALAGAMMSMVSGAVDYRTASAHAIDHVRECASRLTWARLLSASNQVRTGRTRALG